MSLIGQVGVKQRWWMLAATAVLAVVAIVVLDLVTSSIEHRNVRSGLNRLFSHSDLVDLAPRRYVSEGQEATIAVYALDRIPAGRDMVVSNLSLSCGSATFVATNKQGRLLESSRDYRYLNATGPGHFRLVLSVYSSMVNPDGYYVLLRYSARCASSVRVGVLHNRNRTVWEGPPLLSVFREDGDIWTGIYSVGPQWVANKPDVEWVAKALNNGS